MNAFIRPGGQSRQDGKEATRQRVLAAARDLLEAQGFEATSIRAVAAAAHVATGTVLLHFPDKRELLHAAMFEDLRATWTAARNAPPPGQLQPALVQVVQAFIAYYAARPTLSRALLKESLFAEPPWAARFSAQVAEVHAHVVQLAEAAKRTGELDAAVDSALLGTAVLSFYYFALLAWLQGGHPAPLQLFERMLAQHLDGIRGERPRKRGRKS